MIKERITGRNSRLFYSINKTMMVVCKEGRAELQVQENKISPDYTNKRASASTT